MISGNILLEAAKATQDYVIDSKSRIIFTDIDGVLNTQCSRNNGILLVTELVQNLNRLAWSTGSSVVISSTWRKTENAIPYIRYAFITQGFDALFNKNQLPYGNGLSRKDYITEYIEKYNIEKFVILDDKDYMFNEREEFVHINEYVGLKNDSLVTAERILSENVGYIQ